MKSAAAKRRASQVAVDDDGESDSGLKSDGSVDGAADDAEVAEHEELITEMITGNGVIILDDHRLKYDVVTEVPTFDLTVEDEDGVA